MSISGPRRHVLPAFLQRATAPPPRAPRGQGTLEVVGVVVLAAVLVGAGVTAVHAKAPQVTTTVRCAIAKVLAAAGGGAACADGEQPGGDGEQPGEGGDQPGGDDPVDPDTPILNPEDPSDPRCKDAQPSSGPIDGEHPTLVQVGCRNLYVPEDCQTEWDAYRTATEGAARAKTAGALGTCVGDTYDRIEPPCVTSSNSEVDRSEVRILFVKFGSSDGMLVEDLGDGRVRVHLLEGTEVGGEVSGSGKGIDFSVGGVTGYEKGQTYEFHDMAKAQEWLDWYQQYRTIDANVQGLMQTSTICPRPGQCPPNPYHVQQAQKLMERKKELQETEPEHHDLATSSVRSSKVKVSGGVSFPISTSKGKGSGGITPGISGDYTGEVQVEQRDWADGSFTASYKSTDLGGFLIGVKAGGKATKDKKGGKDGEQEDRGGAKGGDALGAEWAGSSSTSVTWGPDGKLGKLIVTLDDQALDSINRAGIDLSVALPYGFGLSGAYETKSKEGKATVTEMILDFDQHPELRDELGPRIDEMFPRDEDGNLEKGDVDVEFDDEVEQTDGGDPVQDVLDEKANVRDLEYDVAGTEETGSVGVDFVGIDLFKASWSHVESQKDLTGSSFEITDVTGTRQTVSPAPKCKALPFTQPDDYYTGEFSDPPVARI